MPGVKHKKHRAVTLPGHCSSKDIVRTCGSWPANEPDIHMMPGLRLHPPPSAPKQNYLLIPKPSFPPEQVVLNLDTQCLVTAKNALKG